jgi:tetratricopeptide (TPR) repeat protein
MMKLSIINLLIFFILFSTAAGAQKADRLSDHPWEYYYQKGLRQYRAEMYDYAVLSLRTALIKNPNLYHAAEVLGDIHVLKNMRMRALEYYKQSLEIKEDQPDLHCKIGELYEFHAERELALVHFKRACELDPGHVRSNSNLVRYYVRDGKTAEAARHFEIGYRGGLKTCLPVFKEAEEEFRKGRYTNAIELYEKTISLGPAMLEAYMGLYESWRVLGRFDMAAEALERLKFVKPDYERAWFLAGLIYFNNRLPGKRKHYLDLAIKNLQRASELDPSKADTWYALSDIYRFMGDDIKYMEMQEKAQKLETAGEGNGKK